MDKDDLKMKTLNWRHTGWSARNFIFSIGQEVIGQLTLKNSWKFNGVYTDKETKLKFIQKSFWDRDMLISKDGKTIGEIKNKLFGHQTLELVTGERFILSTSLWEQEAYWKNEKGELIIKYQQATMSSMGKGQIILTDSLTIEEEKLLISSGLFARKAMHKRRVLVAVLVILVSAASRV